MVAVRFQIGDRVTVRRGTRDPDFADIPLGGWTGSVREIGGQHPEPTYLIAWNDYTLTNMHPVYCQRCVRDDLDTETMWLRQSDLEPAPDQQPSLEQPDRLQPRPLQFDSASDRVRAALGLTSDDLLPDVDLATLRRYHTYLNERLQFPMQAELIEEGGAFASPPLPVVVTRLWPVEELDPVLGLQAEVREGKQVFLVPLASLVVRGDARAFVLLQDYATWYADWLEQTQEDTDDYEGPPRESLVGMATRWTIYASGCGACVGAVMTAVPQARMGFLVGAFLIGALGYIAGAKLGGVIDLTTGTIRRSLTGTLFATLLGVMAGGVAGVLVVAIIGSLLGSILFNLLGNILESLRIRLLSIPAWTFLGIFLGAMVYALLLDSETALNGAMIGATVGGGGVLLLLIGSFFAMAMFGPPPEE